MRQSRERHQGQGGFWKGRFKEPDERRRTPAEQPPGSQRRPRTGSIPVCRPGFLPAAFSVVDA